MSIVSVLNVATPLTAATVNVPDSVPPAGFVPMAIVMLALDVVTTLPKVSWICAVTAGVIAIPAAVFDGCTPNATLFAAAGVMLNVELGPVAVRTPLVAASV